MKRSIYILITLLLITFSASVVTAQETVALEVTVIEAAAEATEADKTLEGVQSQLERGFAAYKSFKAISVQSLVLKAKSKKTLEIKGGTNVLLAFYGAKENTFRMALGVEGTKTILRGSPGTTHIQRVTRDSKPLILAITIK